MKNSMKPVLVAGAALFIVLQALTGFATSDGTNNVPAFKQKTHVAADRMKGLIATPTGDAPKALGVSGARALAYNVIYYKDASLRVATRIPVLTPACIARSRDLMQWQLDHAGKIKTERVSVDSYQRPVGIVYDEAQRDVAELVSARAGKDARCQ